MLTRQRSAPVVLPPQPEILVRFAEDRTIYRQGDPATCWYEVRQGVVRACRYSASGDRHLTNFFYPGDVFGVDSKLREESAEAVTAVELARKDRARLGTALAHDTAALEAALRTMKGCVQLLGHRTAEQKVAAFLLTLAERLGTSAGVPVPMSRTDIADHLRLTMHTVSRTISQLYSRKVIAPSGPQSFRIVDMPAFRLAAGQGHPPEMSLCDEDHEHEGPHART